MSGVLRHSVVDTINIVCYLSVAPDVGFVESAVGS